MIRVQCLGFRDSVYGLGVRVQGSPKLCRILAFVGSFLRGLDHHSA